ncbi:hypothetical protein D3C73_1642110 [compost metagenome]
MISSMNGRPKDSLDGLMPMLSNMVRVASFKSRSVANLSRRLPTDTPLILVSKETASSQ